jgi:hypothetical protein
MRQAWLIVLVMAAYTIRNACGVVRAYSNLSQKDTERHAQELAEEYQETMYVLDGGDEGDDPGASHLTICRPGLPTEVWFRLDWCPDTICLDPKDEAIRCAILCMGGTSAQTFTPGPMWGPKLQGRVAR